MSEYRSHPWRAIVEKVESRWSSTVVFIAASIARLAIGCLAVATATTVSTSTVTRLKLTTKTSMNDHYFRELTSSDHRSSSIDVRFGGIQFNYSNRSMNWIQVDSSNPIGSEGACLHSCMSNEVLASSRQEFALKRQPLKQSFCFGRDSPFQK